MKVVAVNESDPGVYKPWLDKIVLDEVKDISELLIYGLEEGDLAVGILAGHVRGVTLVIDMLYVAKDYRGRGGASMMLRAMRNTCVPYIEEAECSFTENGPDHALLCAVLRHFTFVDAQDTALTIFHSTLSELQDSILAKSDKEFGEAIDPNDEYTMNNIIRFIDSQHLPGPVKGFDSNCIDWDLSRVYMENGRIISYLFTEKVDEDDITLAAAFNDGEPIVLLRMLQTITAKALKKYPPTMGIYVQAITQSSTALILNLLPNAKRLSHRYVFHMKDWVYRYLQENASNKE